MPSLIIPGPGLNTVDKATLDFSFVYCSSFGPRYGHGHGTKPPLDEVPTQPLYFRFSSMTQQELGR